MCAALFAVVIGLGSGTTASAADFGGDCCADLEERVAELEATTARKGNRKVSLKITGYVAEQITYWDDGKESNTYVHGLGPTQTTNVRFTGKAKFAPGWWAGYMIRLQNLQSNPFGLNQNSDDADIGLRTQMSYWFIQSKKLGKVSVGLNVQGAKSAAMFTDKSGTQLFSNYVGYGGFPRFFLRSNAGALQTLNWGDISHCHMQGGPIGGDCNGIIMNGIRYDSPTIAGFKVSASWGEDDMWEVALRYAGKVSGFKVLFGMGYSEMTDEGTSFNGAQYLSKESNFFQVGGYAEHLATGIFVHGSYGREDNGSTVLANGFTAPDSEHYHIKGGIRASLSPLGKTIFYGAYKTYQDQISPNALAAGITSSEFDIIGGGIAQEIDAAAMTVWVNYDHYEADLTGFIPVEDADFLSFGGVIHF